MSEEIEINDLEEDKIKFLRNNSSYSSCYVCLNETNYNSPCSCETSICNSCFKDILLNNGKVCTICKKDFDSDVLENIRIVLPELDLENVDNSDNNSEDSEELLINNSFKNFLKLIRYIISLILVIPFIGLIINSLFNDENSELFSLENFLIGLLVIISLFLLFSIIYSFYYISNIFLNFLNNIFRYNRLD